MLLVEKEIALIFVKLLLIKCSMYREFALHFYGTSAPRRSVHVRSQRYVLHDTTGRTDASWDTLRTWRTDPKMHLERALSLEDTSICVQ